MTSTDDMASRQAVTEMANRLHQAVLDAYLANDAEEADIRARTIRYGLALAALDLRHNYPPATAFVIGGHGGGLICLEVHDERGVALRRHHDDWGVLSTPEVTRGLEQVARAGFDLTGLPIHGRGRLVEITDALCDPDVETGERSRCRTERCPGDPHNGEGWDGFCGTCADRRQAAKDREDRPEPGTA